MTYTLHPSVAFFEFIPVEHSDEPNPNTRFVDQLEPGQAYELVITNLSGLFRYKLGDVVEVVGYNKHAPVVRFCYRYGGDRTR